MREKKKKKHQVKMTLLTPEQMSGSVSELTYHMDELRMGYDQLTAKLTTSHAQLVAEINQIKNNIACLPQINNQ